MSKAVTPRVVTLIDWYYKKRAAVEFTTYVSESAASLASAERNVDLVHVNECTSSSRRGVIKFDRVRDSHTPMTRDSWKVIARRISVQLSHVTFGHDPPRTARAPFLLVTCLLEYDPVYD